MLIFYTCLMLLDFSDLLAFTISSNQFEALFRLGTVSKILLILKCLIFEQCLFMSKRLE